MPKFVYRPEGAEPQSWEFDPNKLLSPECIAVEKLVGKSYGDCVDAFFDRSMVAAHAFLYILLKRDTPVLKPSDVVFSYGDYDLEPTPDEAREALARLDGVPEDERDARHYYEVAELEKLIPADEPGDADPKDSD